jgi:hypothetical protein
MHAPFKEEVECKMTRPCCLGPAEDAGDPQDEWQSQIAFHQQAWLFEFPRPA